jgi:hypothetical protein
MTGFLQLAASLREQMTANLSRSDVLKPLAWLIGLLLTGLVLAITAKAAGWVVAGLMGAVGAGVVLYMGAYVFCLFSDRDALRSERYTLQKMAIEHGLYGDSRIGLQDAPVIDARGQVRLPSDAATESDQ